MTSSAPARTRKSIGRMEQDVFLVLGTAARPLTVKDIHARLTNRRHSSTSATVLRALQVLLDRGIVRVAKVGTRAERDSRITAILALPGRDMDDRGAMRFRLADGRRDQAKFAAKLEQAMIGLPRSAVGSLRRGFLRMSLQ